MKKALITFVKAPVPGTVKTRMQTGLPAETVAAIYRSFVTEIVSRCARMRGTDRLLGCAPSGEHEFLRETVKQYRLKAFDQRGKDLGERIINAFRDHFKKGYGRIVLIGSDSPTIPLDTIRRAFTALNRHDLVLGPCCDGGIYLIGARRKIVPSVFMDIPWDSSKVLVRTLDNIEHTALSYYLLPFWYDVDTVEELEFLKKHLAYLKRPSFLPQH